MRGALLPLINPENFEQVEGLTAEETAAVFEEVLGSFLMAITPFPAGAIMAYPDSSFPPGWIECMGQTLQQSVYPELYDAVGDRFGSAPTNEFRLPDLRSRGIVGARAAGEVVTGLSERVIGEYGGEESHVLTTTEMPPHQHQLDITLLTGQVLGIPLSGQPAGDVGDLSTKSTGGGQAHNNMHPFGVLSWMIFTGKFQL